jgi:ribokinase
VGARRRGATTILNPAPGAPIEPALLAVTDWLVPNESEFVGIGGRPLIAAGHAWSGAPSDRAAATDGIEEDLRTEDTAIDQLGERLGIGLVVTLGERGVALRRRGGRIERIPAPRADVTDTTGAGDAFVGAFAAGLALGLEPTAAATLGCAAASDSVTRHGTQTSFSDADSVRDMLLAVGGASDRAKPDVPVRMPRT